MNSTIGERTNFYVIHVYAMQFFDQPSKKKKELTHSQRKKNLTQSSNSMYYLKLDQKMAWAFFRRSTMLLSLSHGGNSHVLISGSVYFASNFCFFRLILEIAYICLFSVMYMATQFRSQMSRCPNRPGYSIPNFFNSKFPKIM